MFLHTLGQKQTFKWGRTRSDLVFSGKGQPLPSVAGDADVVAKVAAEADAIGYVVLFTLP